jgi:hypothetical protein
MSVDYSNKIRAMIDDIENGAAITAKTFPKFPKNTLFVVLCRLCKEGTIVRVKRGVYSKVKKTRFGDLKLSPLDALSYEVNQDANKCFGGVFLLNQLKLTTQVPTVIEILNNKSSYQTKIGSTSIRYVKIRPKITHKTKEYIRYLEVIKKIRYIPDGDMFTTFAWLVKYLVEKESTQLALLVKVANDYPPRVRAILGSLLNQDHPKLAQALRKTLNENSYYRIGYLANLIQGANQWSLKS